MTNRRVCKGGCPLAVSAVLLVAFHPSVLSGGDLAAAESAQTVYVSSEASGTVVAVDAASLQVLRQIDIGDRPHNLEMTPDGLLVIATQGTDSVAVLDPTKDQAPVQRHAIGAPPHDVAAADHGRTVFVVSGRGPLVRLDPATGRILQTIELEGSPHNVIASGESAWITDVSARRILIVDEDQSVEALPISIVGHDLAVRPASGELWVTPWNSLRVIVLDRETRKEIAGFEVGQHPSHKHVAFTEDGNEAWITEPASGSLFVVDAQARRLLEAVDLGGHPHHVSFAAGRAYVAAGPEELVVLDVNSREVVGRQTVGSGVHDVELDLPAD